MLGFSTKLGQRKEYRPLLVLKLMLPSKCVIMCLSFSVFGQRLLSSWSGQVVTGHFRGYSIIASVPDVSRPLPKIFLVSIDDDVGCCFLAT